MQTHSLQETARQNQIILELEIMLALETRNTTQQEIATQITTREAIIATHLLEQILFQEAKVYLHQDPTARLHLVAVAEDHQEVLAVAEEDLAVAEEDNLQRSI